MDGIIFVGIGERENKRGEKSSQKHFFFGVRTQRIDIQAQVKRLPKGISQRVYEMEMAQGKEGQYCQWNRRAICRELEYEDMSE